MINKNPNVIVLVKEQINFKKVVESLNNNWNFECKYERVKQKKFTNYIFKYENIEFVCSEFLNKFPEKINIDNCINDEKIAEVLENNCAFWVISVVGNCDVDLIKVYSLFTRVIMSILNVCNMSIIYNTRSNLLTDSQTYLNRFDIMKKCFDEGKEIFPIELYISIKLRRDNGLLNAFTQGFEVFNDCEIEISNSEIQDEEMINIIKYIIINVVSRNDKIKNKDIIPIPLKGEFEEAIIKKVNSHILDKDVLKVIF